MADRTGPRSPDIVERLRFAERRCYFEGPIFDEAADEIERLRGGISAEALAEALYECGLAALLVTDAADRVPWPKAPARLRTDYKRHARHVLRLLPGGEPPE